MVKLVIIGLGSAGFAALLSAKKYNPKAEITIIDKKDFDLLHPCGLPYALEGILPLDSLKHDIGAERMGIKIIKKEAARIDHKNKKVILGDSTEIDYDSLILATGSSPIIPPIKGANELLGKNVFTLHTFEDAKNLEKKAVEGNSAVVIGAGAIGLEIAFALREKKIKVKIIEASPNILPRAFDADMVSSIEDYLKQKGIELMLGKKVSEIKPDAVLVDGEEIKCDLVVLSTGSKANLKIAEESGLKIGEKNLQVNEFLQTNVNDVYAVGDIIEVPNIINKKEISIGLANSAYLQGIIAGQNALGAKRKYAGTMLSFVTVIGDLEIASTGFTKTFAEKSGIKVVEGRVKGKNKYAWFPGAEDLLVKIIAEEASSKIVGAQAVGKGAHMRINVVATALRAGLALDELMDIELAYCPPISEAYDVLFLACELAKRKLTLVKK